jgi:hypothetical protein
MGQIRNNTSLLCLDSVGYLVGSASVESVDRRKKFLLFRMSVIAMNSSQESTKDRFDTLCRVQNKFFYLWHCQMLVIQSHSQFFKII